MPSNVTSFKPSNLKPSQAVPMVASAVGAVNSDVAKPSVTYEAGEKRRELPRTLMGGTAAMREAGDKYLPPHPVESSEAYHARLQGAFLYNAFEMTRDAQAGKFFAEPVGLKEDVPPVIAELCENIDGEGRALTPFCIDLVKEAFVDGVSFVLVDFPSIATGSTMAEQRLSGARPYWVLVKAEDVIGWRSQDRAGKQTLTQVRIRENVMEPDGEFGEKMVKRIREMVPGAWRLWEQLRDPTTGATKWTVVKDGATSLAYIPLVPFYTNAVGFMDGSPPLRALAEMNQEHWISLSEQKRALSFARFDMLVVIGGGDEGTSITVGPNKVLGVPMGGDVKTVTQSGAGIQAGRQDLLDIQQRMATAGLELRVENAGQTTATAAAIDSDETNAGLRAVAKNLEDALEIALQASADYLRLPDGGSVEIADAFGGNVIPGTALEITSLNGAGLISRSTAWSELKRRHVLSEDFDPNTEQILLEDEAAQGLQRAIDQQQAFSEANPQQQPDNTQQPPPGGTPAAP